jgi:hypothetical protein
MIPAIHGADGQELYQGTRAPVGALRGWPFSERHPLGQRRAERFGPGTPLEIGRPAAVATGLHAASGRWTVGYTATWLGPG